MLEIDWKPIRRLLDDGLEDFLFRHWGEVCEDKEAVPLAPDWPRIFALEKQGVYRAIGLYRHGRLVGYAAYSIHAHINFRSTLCASNDLIFVQPEHRGYAGGRLLLTADRLLGALGVRKVIYECPVSGGKNLGASLARLGYKPTDTLFCKLMEPCDGRWRQSTNAVHPGAPGAGG